MSAVDEVYVIVFVNNIEIFLAVFFTCSSVYRILIISSKHKYAFRNIKVNCDTECLYISLFQRYSIGFQSHLTQALRSIFKKTHFPNNKLFQYCLKKIKIVMHAFRIHFAKADTTKHYKNK